MIEILISLLDLLIIYLSLIIEVFAPIYTQYDIANLTINTLFIVFFFDILVFIIWIFTTWKFKKLDNFISTKSIISNDYIVLNIFFRFLPFLSHMWNFLTWYNKNINKVKWFFSLIFWHIFIFIVSSTVLDFLWKLFNPIGSTAWLDVTYYIGITSFIIWVVLFSIYFKLKLVLLNLKK